MTNDEQAKTQVKPKYGPSILRAFYAPWLLWQQCREDNRKLRERYKEMKREDAEDTTNQ